MPEIQPDRNRDNPFPVWILADIGFGLSSQWEIDFQDRCEKKVDRGHFFPGGA